MNINSETLGPYTSEEIIQWINEGKIHSNTYIWYQELSEWHLISQLEEFDKRVANTAVAKKPKNFSILKNKYFLIFSGSFCFLIFLIVFWARWPASSMDDLDKYLTTVDMTNEDFISLVDTELEKNQADLPSGDWTMYSELEEEKENIENVITEFTNSLAAGETERALSLIHENNQGYFEELFENEDAVVLLAELLSNRELSFLSEKEDPQVTTVNRTAEYTIDVNGANFYVVFMKVDGEWLFYKL